MFKHSLALAHWNSPCMLNLALQLSSVLLPSHCVTALFLAALHFSALLALSLAPSLRFVFCFLNIMPHFLLRRYLFRALSFFAPPRYLFVLISVSRGFILFVLGCLKKSLGFLCVFLFLTSYTCFLFLFFSIRKKTKTVSS